MSKAESIKSNIPEFSVSELAFSLKRTLEENYAHVRVRGELSRVKIHTSGHLYTDLKDADSVINAVCWKGTVSKLSIRPEEGLEVVCTGRISTYPARSNYQLIIESMELAGQGALLKMLEERKKKLAAEGLFDAERKKEIPFLPGIIGVITSPTGAVIRDILHRLEDRFPRHVIVWPVLVQGPGAAEQVARAIDGFNKLTPRPDLLIVARGGGSLEDLMPFNEEIVVRAAANSQIPLISAVGHETDTTLIDYAADLRAPTPTGAAEMAVPVRANLIAQILDDEQRLVSGMARMISELRHRLRAAKLAEPGALLDMRMQSLDHAGDRLDRVFGHYISLQQNNLTHFAAKLREPRHIVNAAQQSLDRWGEHLTGLAPKLTTDLQKKLDQMGKLLEAYSFENVLERGFAIVRDEKGHVITGAAQTAPGQEIELLFAKKSTARAVVKKV
ncbi:MAG: exodeoxyribonuclease VII large subunit [Alphaproteobacteria bacterium]|nr:exodeoxyribonuclease VII large subunit [Alphaproteobacteria bacterium]